MLFCRLSNLGGQLGPGAVGQPPRLHVGAGDIHLDHIHPGLRQLLTHDAVLLRGISGDIGDHFRIKCSQEGQLLLDKGVHAGIFQPHRVEDAHGGLGNAGGGVAASGVEGQPLGTDAAQLPQVVKLAVLPAKAEGARGHNYGIFQRHPRQLHLHVHVRHPSPPPPRQTPGRPCRRALPCRPSWPRRTPDRPPRRSPSAPPWTPGRGH